MIYVKNAHSIIARRIAKCYNISEKRVIVWSEKEVIPDQVKCDIVRWRYANEMNKIYWHKLLPIYMKAVDTHTVSEHKKTKNRKNNRNTTASTRK